MMLALGVGGWTAGLFHLTTHAFFKALLFLGAGAVIHSLGHEQDLRKMGGLLTKMPVTAVTMLAGVFAVAGVPLFSGWYSKDAVLAAVFNFVEAHRAHALLLLLPTVTIGLTAFYMFRLWFLAFAGKPRDAALHEQAHEPSLLLTAPLAILAVLSLMVAWGWPPGDAEASWLAGFIHLAQPASVDVDFGFDETAVARNHAYAQNIAMLFLVLGVVFAALIYLHHALDAEQAVEQFPGIYRFLMHKWYFDELYAAAFVRPTLTLGRYLAAFDRRALDGALNNGTRGVVRLARWEGRFDGGIVDGLVNLTARVVYAVGASLRGVQTGSLRGYVLFLALAAVSLFVALTYFVSIVAAG
jgi:NADH-quinone oxidoreductase subunit L